MLVDTERYAYYREEVGGLLLGVFEPVAAPWAVDGIPKGFAFGEINPDWDRMMPYLEKVMDRVPIVKDAGVHKFFCGPESFTADNEPIMGEAPELKNFYVAAGFNSLGILLGGGAGKIMAQWIVRWLRRCRHHRGRYCPHVSLQNTPKFRQDRTVEALGYMFEEPFHNRQHDTARDVRKSSFHPRTQAAGAYFGEYAGWEYPDWYRPEGVEPKVEYSWGRQNWFEYQAPNTTPPGRASP